MATVEESKRAEVRRTREQAEAIQRVTDDAGGTLRAGMEGFQSMARTMQQALENSFGAMSELTRRSTGQVTQGFSVTGGDAQGLTEQASQNLRVAAQNRAAVAPRVHEKSREAI